MYSPYLKGKQNEFLALRDLVDQLSDLQKQNVLPIIEPVKRQSRDAITAFTAMKGANWPFALVLNPRVGEFERGDNDYFALVQGCLNDCREKWVPAFILENNENVLDRIRQYDFDNVMVILPKLEDVEPWLDLIKGDFVRYVVLCDGDSIPLLRKVQRIGEKTIIRMDESFVAEQKNAAYAKNLDHRFTDKHTYYKEFKYNGFGDYTTLPSAFISGGVSPTVVAIHLTYNKNQDEVWIRHFLSDPDANSNSNVQGKFFDAANQINEFFQTKPNDKDYAVQALIDFVNNKHYPGLGAIKKWSIIHHILLMSNF